MVPPARRSTCARHNVRLREFVPSCRRATTTYEGRDDETLQGCKLAPAKTMVLEVRQEGEPWVAFNPNEMVLRVIRWLDGAVKLSDPSAFAGETLDVPDELCAVVRVPGDQVGGPGATICQCCSRVVLSIHQFHLRGGADALGVAASRTTAGGDRRRPPGCHRLLAARDPRRRSARH